MPAARLSRHFPGKALHCRSQQVPHPTTRGFFLRMMATLGLTVLMIVGLIAGLIATLAVPAALVWLALPDWVEVSASLTRWIVLFSLGVTGLAALYRWNPARANAKWRWLTVGSLVSAALWLTVQKTDAHSVSQSLRRARISTAIWPKM